MIKLVKFILILFIFLYGVLFVSAFLSPYTIEKHAHSFIAQEVSKRTHERIDNIGKHKIFNSKLMVLAKKKMKEEQEKVNKIKTLLHLKADKILADVVTKMHDQNSKCRKKHERFFHGVLVDVKLSLTKGINQIKSFMKRGYMVVMQKVLDDLKIFLGSNFLALFALFLLLHYKAKHEKTLVWLAGFMLVSTLVCSYFYIFNQNWFFTLIFNDFVGFTYLVYLLVLFSFFVDIGFNKARVTEVIGNAIGSAFSSF